jgi:hypothetical protein
MNMFDSAVWKKAAGALGIALFVMLSSLCFGQQLTGTLTGTTFDSSGAVVPNAQVSMKNESSGDTRTTVSNGSGYFSITAVQPGSYTISVTAAGFKTWKETGITFAQGDNRTLPNIALQVGDVSTSIEVQAGGATVPLDTAEVSTTLEQNLIQNVPLQGRDAGELLKLMPGMAIANGGAAGSMFNDAVVGTNNGPIGTYSSNGTQPNGAMAFMLDGANLVDPGNAGTQIANINQDMVSEVKVLMSSYSAEYAKGPTIFQAFSKSGGKNFHGEGYFYARNSTFNSIDAFTASQIAAGTQTLALGDPYQSFYYMGGNVGGPIRLPFTSFNKNHDKLFFWAGYEYMKQNPAGSIINYNVPTPEQFAGDFSNTTIDGIPGTTVVSTGKTLTQQLQSTWGYAYNNLCCSEPAGATNTSVPSSLWDPNAKAIMGLYPTPNITPSAGNGWNNFSYVQQVPQNRWEATGKVDYAISDNTKLSVSYTRQIENDQHPIGVWWTPPWDLPYPSNVVAATTSNEIMSNFTHVFSPTTTNEFVFTYARYINPATLQDPSAVDRTALGFNVTGLFGHTASQIPNILGPWGGVFPNIEEFSFDGSFNGGNTFGALKSDPALYDNFTKVIGSHTLKAGFYWDTSGNVQSFGGLEEPGGPDIGVYNLGWGSNSTGNVVADFLLGRAANYEQESTFPTQSIQFHQWSIYGQDSYKANRQLTLNYGLRADHIGQMYGPPNGMQVWDPATYVQGPSVANPGLAAAPANDGLVWSAIDKNIPNSGLSSPLFYYSPRVGLAYDIFGTGKSVLRAGFAVFRYQFAVNDVGGPAGGPAGAFTFATPSITSGFAQIDSGAAGFTPPSSVSQNGSTISAFTMGDNQVPRTMDWNVTLSQALPWRSVFEVSYVGNKSNYEFLNGANGKIEDINNMNPGTFWLADPKLGAAGAGVIQSPSPLSCNNSSAASNAIDCGANSAAYNISFNSNDYRPLNQYQDIYLITHDSYQNYNSLQASWQKQSGPVTFLLNYTFSKNLGIRDGETSNGAGNGPIVDPFSIKNNYGTLEYDRTNILNASYVWNLPNFIHGNKFAGGAINGWQLSGYTSYQSGVPLQPALGGDLNATYAGGLTTPLNGAPDLPDNTILLPNGLRANGVNPSTWFGTSSINMVMPTLICDPTKHASGLYFNPNCFGMPAYGQQGALIWPNLRTPAYFDSDLGVYKSFKITESQSVQFRVSATNFLNHPLPQFGLAGTSDETLNFQSNTTMTEPNQAECNQLANNAPAPCQVNIVGISPTNTNTSLTGKPAFKNGSRQVTFSLKYFF